MTQEPLPNRPKHLLQDHAPTVIHNPEEEQTLLYRWMKRTLEKGPLVWVGAAVVIVTACLLWIVVNSLSAGGRSASTDAWADLMLDSTSRDERIKTAEQIAGTTPGPAAGWALLEAAKLRFEEAAANLPANRDAALPLLSTARDLFRRASDMAGTDGTLRRMADLGIARVLETRGELGEAVQQYRKVAETWPDTAEGQRARKLADELSRQDVVAFYQKFSTFKPTEATLPPGGAGGLSLPPGGTGSVSIPGLSPLGSGSPPSSGSMPSLPPLGTDTPPAPTPPPGPEPTTPRADAPKVEMPRAEVPKAATTSTLPFATIEPADSKPAAKPENPRP